MKTLTRIFSISSLLALSIYVIGCKKLIEVDAPQTSVSSQNIYDNDATAIGAVTSLYVNMMSSSIAGTGPLTGLSCIAGLSADELTYNRTAGSAVLAAYYENRLTNVTAGGSGDFWGVCYQRLYLVNSAIEGISKSISLTPNVKRQLLGESKFMRAFYYFYLTNLYGDVPLVMTTDYSINSLIGKSPRTEVFKFLIEDLKEAQNLLSEKYLQGDGKTPYAGGQEERVRPTKWAATALLARTYLYIEDWSNAELQSTELISNSPNFRLAPIDQVFIKNNSEAIWQLQPTYAGANTADANTFVIPSTGPTPSNPVFLSNDLVDEFNELDQRKLKWISSVSAKGSTYFFPNKYKVIRSADPNAPVVEYNTVLRLSEQFLIRAEARAHLENIEGSIDDLDKIRGRSGLKLIRNINPTINEIGLIDSIMKERRLELFTEWGHRWLDLKRTKKINEVMTLACPKKSVNGTWKAYQQYYPISLSELQSNPKLEQIPGY